MTNIYWHRKINQKVRRDGTSWNEISGFIEDKTKSGKVKRRLANSKEKRTFSVKFIFTFEEYELFSEWYQKTILYGSKSFMFPKIDSETKEYVEYRITNDGVPSYSNRSGKLIECSMKWEEI